MKRAILLSFIFAICSPTPGRGESIQRSGYIITADAGIAADAEQIAKLTDSAIHALSEAFPAWDVPQTIQSYRLQINVHATPTAEANEGTASLFTGNQNGNPSARLELLAPSKYPAGAQTNVGEPKDTKYIERLLIHEISTIVFERVTGKKPAGWRFYSAPSWFVQGIEQYVAFRQTKAGPSLQLYIDRVRKDPNIVQTDFGLQVSEPYIGGAALLAFIDERYGWPKIQKLLESPEPTFGAAIRKQLDVTSDGFAAEFQKWLKAK